ncbi:hypothetical protein K432DRAFT_377213, partial [Lepidopterella palustris CBS 459.81]
MSPIIKKSRNLRRKPILPGPSPPALPSLGWRQPKPAHPLHIPFHPNPPNLNLYLTAHHPGHKTRLHPRLPLHRTHRLRRRRLYSQIPRHRETSRHCGCGEELVTVTTGPNICKAVVGVPQKSTETKNKFLKVRSPQV